MSERLERLITVARETKEALYGEWKKNQYFEDCNNFYGAGRGIMSEAMGLTSVMLMYVCFAENRGVYTSINDPETKVIVENAINYIYSSIETDGYTVAPLRDVEETRGVIDKEHSYVDTLTWVLSSATLTIYATRNNLISLGEEIERKAIELIADSLARISDGQLENGSWGFSTDKGAKSSLYATYAVAASLGDFLDYIFGELEYYNNPEKYSDITACYDWQTVDAINTYYRENPKSVYPKDNITETVNKVKSGLQMWLLENCLPLLPKLADCVPLEEDEMARIGMVRQTSSERITNLGGKDYINLYYAYYVIDILTTSSSDKRFNDIAAGRDGVTIDNLKTVYKEIMRKSDYDYFFEKNGGSNAPTLFMDYINQAIHSARMNFSAARRSGREFWDSSASELIIPWEHNDVSKSRIEEARGDVEFTEPALIPMALRANTVYCFYIIERADVTVDNMFDLICDDRSPRTETVKKDTRIKNLWDRVNYSLPVTERSIEAIVDYADYLEKTAATEAAVSSDGGEVSIESAIEAKIAQYISSDKGRELIKNMGFVRKDEVNLDVSTVEKIVDARVSALIDEKLKGVTVATNAAPVVISEDSFNVDAIIAELENIQHFIGSHYDIPDRYSDDAREKLAYALFELYKGLFSKHIQQWIEGAANDQSHSREVLEALKKQFDGLAETLAENCTSVKGNLDLIYKSIVLK